MRKFFLIPVLALFTCVSAWAGVARIGQIQYETLNDAFAAAKNGDAIEMLDDATVSSSITINNIKVTLHMQGYTITNNVANEYLFKICGEAGNLTVVGNADGISANARMVIGNANAFGFAACWDSYSAFIAYNVDFDGIAKADYGYILGGRNRNINNYVMLQDCSGNIASGSCKGIIFHGDDAYHSTYKIIRGSYVFKTTFSKITPQTFRGPLYGGTVDIQNVEVLMTKGHVCQAGYTTVVSYVDSKFSWEGANDWKETAITSAGYSYMKDNSYYDYDPDDTDGGRWDLHALCGDGYYGNNSTPGVSIVNSGEYSHAKNAIQTESSGGVVIVNGGKFTGLDNSIKLYGGTRYKTTPYLASNALIIVNGGEFIGNISLENSGLTAATALPTTTNLEINGGTFKNLNTISLQNSYCHLTIKGGTFSGSAISAETLANYVDTENGYIITDNGDGSFTVTQQQSTDDKTNIVWQTASDWSSDQTPTASTEVAVAANQTVTVGDNLSTEVVAEALSIALAPNSELVIKSGSTLVVGEGGITGTGAGASDAKIIVEEGAQLLIDPAAEQHPFGTVKYKSVAKVDGDYEGGHIWEQIGVPTMGNPSVEATEHAAMYFNVWDVTNGWVALSDYSQFNTPFKGYNFTNASNGGNVVYTFSGQLVGNQQQALDFPRDGYSFFANSYTGPIDIVTLLRQFETGSDVQRGVYLYNPIQEQYMSINEDNAGKTVFGISYPSEIKPMQAFYLYSHATTSGSASYEELVWTPARAAMSNPAPRRRALSANVGLAIQLKAENGRYDNVILAETANSDLNTYKMMNPSKSVNIYAVSENGNMANFAAEDINNTFIGFSTNGSASYTLSFDAVNGEYALRDMYTGQTVRIENGLEYVFEAIPNGTIENRFQIVKAPKVTTGMDQVLDDVLSTKVIENGVLYIIKDGVKYNAQGALVK